MREKAFDIAARQKAIVNQKNEISECLSRGFSLAQKQLTQRIEEHDVLLVSMQSANSELEASVTEAQSRADMAHGELQQNVAYSPVHRAEA